MTRQRIKLLQMLVVVLVVLSAGCMGIFGETDTVPQTETPDAASQNGAEMTPPDGFSDAGVENSTVAADTIAAKAVQAGSYRVSLDSVFEYKEKEGLSGEYHVTRSVHAFEEREMVTEKRDRGNREMYVTSDMRYIKRDSGEIATDRGPSATFNITKSTYHDHFDLFLKGLEYTQTDATPEDDVTRYTYTAETFADKSVLNEVVHGTVDVKNPSSTFVVDSNGRLHEFHYEAVHVGEDGEEVTIDMAYTFDQYGSATVGEPAWVSEA